LYSFQASPKGDGGAPGRRRGIFVLTRFLYANRHPLRSKAPAHEWAAKALRSNSNCSSTGLVLSDGGALAAGV